MQSIARRKAPNPFVRKDELAVNENSAMPHGIGISCFYYTMKQKCLLARAFLRSRQLRSSAKHCAAPAAKTYAVSLSAIIIPQIAEVVNSGKMCNVRNNLAAGIIEK